MTRTLADMTPDERDDCVGSWVKVTPTGSNSPSRTPFLGVLASLDANAYWGKGGYVVRGPHTCAFYFAEMELQPDLPRAWTPNGEPVPGDCEYAVGHVVEYADGQKDCRPRYREDSRQSALESAEDTKDDGYVAMSRYVSDWEVAP